MMINPEVSSDLATEKFAVEFVDVSLKINRNSLFQNLNFKIRAPGCTLLLGPTGSGKTTLLRLIKGVIPFLFKYDTSGIIRIFTEEKTQSTYFRQSLDTGMLLQEPIIQLIEQTVEENLAMVLGNFGLPSSEIRRRIDFSASRFSILKRSLHQKVSSLSSGETTLAAFCSLMILEPKIILCDEPLSSLDSPNETQMLRFLTEFSSQGTLVVATHSILPFVPLDPQIVILDPKKLQITAQGTLSNLTPLLHRLDWLEFPPEFRDISPKQR